MTDSKPSPQITDSAAKFDRSARPPVRGGRGLCRDDSDLIAETGEARTVDLAARFGVTSPTVNAIIRRLQREDLVETRPYRSIFLTEAGKALAEASRERHRIVRDFRHDRRSRRHCRRGCRGCRTSCQRRDAGRIRRHHAQGPRLVSLDAAVKIQRPVAVPADRRVRNRRRARGPCDTFHRRRLVRPLSATRRRPGRGVQGVWSRNGCLECRRHRGSGPPPRSHGNAS